MQFQTKNLGLWEFAELKKTILETIEFGFA